MSKRRLRMADRGRAGQALGDDARIFVDEDGHVLNYLKSMPVLVLI